MDTFPWVGESRCLYERLSLCSRLKGQPPLGMLCFTSCWTRGRKLTIFSEAGWRFRPASSATMKAAYSWKNLPPAFSPPPRLSSTWNTLRYFFPEFPASQAILHEFPPLRCAHGVADRILTAEGSCRRFFDLTKTNTFSFKSRKRCSRSAQVRWRRFNDTTVCWIFISHHSCIRSEKTWNRIVYFREIFFLPNTISLCVLFYPVFASIRTARWTNGVNCWEMGSFSRGETVRNSFLLASTLRFGNSM